ncbi:murein hydrolase activator EnvC [Sutterella sp.]|uniref:murein hydrolase activator EnvC family protein n=1 Tax=Sutterella sp. TaxID=1981025 RepID=UPI0026DF069F|nr:peptidoglycan DD-metalloendopeptidase family protein [Sutterella sp.]MDO5530736.1 peptidoglycan DD-metalloendopeptidase family protein [Sutterella sp.]
MKFSILRAGAAAAALALTLASAPAPAPAAPSGSDATARQKERAESQKASVEKRLSDMQKQLSAREAESEAANSALKKADQAISEANKKLRTLKSEREKVEERLKELRGDSREVGRSLSGAEALLSQIVRAQYLHAQRHTWQSLIEGGNPNELARTSAALGYLSVAQVRAADALEAEQNRIDTVSQETRARRAELSKIAAEEEKNRRELLSEKRDRQEAVKKLSRDIATQQAAIEKLQKDQARLENLVSEIDSRLEKERAAEEAERRREAERRKADAKPVAPLPAGNFAQLRGRLVRPVKGTVAARYGTRRTGSALWQGILFRAPEGADVSACAAGRVVFSDWLRGYGNLLIIDHGGTYMSVYANNESVLKNVGDRVRAGETVATVGSSGASDEPGLYFEIRYKGKPVNPQPWLSK